jgi:predicted alpha/beta hydrolase
MSEPKTKPTDASVEDFLAAVEPARRREEGRTLCALMQAVSGEAPVMWGPSIVGFGRYANVTADGKSAGWPRMGFSPRKAALTLYLASTPQTEAMLARLGPHTTSTACLYIKRLDQADMDVLRALCVASWDEMKRRYP